MTCDASTVVAAAVNLVRLEGNLLAGVQTARLNLNPLGPAVDAQSLENVAYQFRKYNQRQHLAVDTYLLAVIRAGSLVPATILASAIDFERLSARKFEECKAYLIALKAGGSMTSEGLAASADDFSGYSPKDHWAAQTYCLAIIAGGSTDPATLLNSAKAFLAVSQKQLETMQLWLLCEWSSCTDVPADLIPVITGNYTAGIITSLSILLPRVCCAPHHFTIYEADDAIGTGAVAIASSLIAASHAGEVNYSPPDYPFAVTPTKAYVLVKQFCDDGSSSAYSNAVEVDITCGVATNVVEVTGAGTAAANGFYVFNQTASNSAGVPVYINADSGYSIVFLGGVAGTEAFLYDAGATPMYRLLDTECFPCGNWTVAGGVAPAPTVDWGTEGAEVANDWADRVVGNGGGRPSFNTVYAAMTFWDSLSTPTKGKLKHVNLFAPDNWTAATTPLIKIWGGTQWDKVNVTAVGFGSASAGLWGITPDAQTGLYTSFNPAAASGLSVSDFGMTVYTNHPDFVPGSFGGRSASNYLNWYCNFQGAWYFSWPDNSGTSQISSTIPARFRGFVSYNRSASNRADVWYANANSPFASGGSATGALTNGLPNAGIYLGAFNDTGTFQAGSERGYAFCAFHTALNATEAEDLYDAVEQFRRDVGGGYIPDTTVGSEVVTEFQNNIYFGTGAALSAGTRAALDTFWEALVTAGIHNKMLTICPFVPDSFLAAMTPMVCNGTYRTLTYTNFVAGDLTVNGLAGDALGKYIRMQYWTPSTLWFDYDDIGITLYIHTGKSEGSTDGACANAGYVNAYSVQNPSDNMYCDLGNAGASRIGPVADVAATGYYSGNRTAAADMRLYKAKSTFAHAQIGQNLVATADVRNTITVPMVLFAYNINATIGGYSSKRVSFWAAHLGLTSSESSAFYNAIQALRTALGGGYV